MSNLSSSPKEFLMQSVAVAPSMAKNIVYTSNQDSLLEVAFTVVIENSAVKFQQSNDKSRDKSAVKIHYLTLPSLWQWRYLNKVLSRRSSLIFSLGFKIKDIIWYFLFY